MKIHKQASTSNARDDYGFYGCAPPLEQTESAAAAKE